MTKIDSRDAGLAAAAAEVQAHDAAIDAGTSPPRSWIQTRTRAADPAQVYSVRIPTQLIVELRKAADQRDMTVSALIREWTSERLAAELNDGQSLRDSDPADLAASALRNLADLIESGAVRPDPSMVAALAATGPT